MKKTEIKNFIKALKTERARKITYNVILSLVLVGSVLLSIFAFKESFFRLFDSFKDIGSSAIYYIRNLRYLYIGTPNDYTAAVTTIPESVESLLPWEWEEFCARMETYWPTFFSEENVEAFTLLVAESLLYLTIFLTLITPLFLGFVLLVVVDLFFVGDKERKAENSKPLNIWLKIQRATWDPAKEAVKKFFKTINDKKKYYRFYKYAIVLVWLLNLNVITVGVETIAYLIYFVAAFSFNELYIQVAKLIMDLSVYFTHLPGFIQLIGEIVAYNVIVNALAKAGRRAREEVNEAFVESLSLIVLIVGTTGAKKTTLEADITLTKEVEFRKRALSKIEANELKFANFPWANIWAFFKKAEKKHALYNLASIHHFIGLLRTLKSLKKSRADYRADYWRYLRKHYGYTFKNIYFDYDITQFSTSFDNSLYIESFFEIVENYLCEYWIYRAPTSLVVGNIPIRSRIKWKGDGPFPIMDADFFKRKSEDVARESQFSHIVDQDFFRIEKQMDPTNKNVGALDVGVVVFDEWAKDRGNQVTNRKFKGMGDDVATPMNDGMNLDLKTRRQSAFVENDPYVFFCGTEQRPDSMQADTLQLCDIIYAGRDFSAKIGIPLFSPCELLNDILSGIYGAWKKQKKKHNSDMTFLSYIVTSIYRWWWSWYLRKVNEFGYLKGKLKRKYPGENGETVNDVYYLQYKKIYAQTFASACLDSFYRKRSDLSNIGLNDMPVYKETHQTTEEMAQQNSYYYNSLLKVFFGDDVVEQYDSIREADKQLTNDANKVRSENVRLINDSLSLKSLLAELKAETQRKEKALRQAEADKKQLEDKLREAEANGAASGDAEGGDGSSTKKSKSKRGGKELPVK